MNNKNLKSFNLNNDVAVKLTPKGHEYLQNFFDNNEVDKRTIKLKGDILVIKLWMLSKIFGPYMDIGIDSVFQGMKIIISDNDLKEIKSKQKEDKKER